MIRNAIMMGVSICLMTSSRVEAQPVTRDEAMRAAVHPVSNQKAMQDWLRRVPQTKTFPADFTATLQGHGPAFVVEMSTRPGCLPCDDLWAKLSAFGRRYGWRVRLISVEEAMLRSGRLGLPWVGHPVAWARPMADDTHIVPVAIGTDHPTNLNRNLYLAAKMLTGVRAAVGVRAMAKFTGIVGLPVRQTGKR